MQKTCNVWKFFLLAVLSNIKLSTSHVFCFQIIADLADSPNPFNIWQVKLILKQIFNTTTNANLISKETALSLKEEITRHCFNWEEKSKPSIKKFLKGDELPFNFDNYTFKMLSCYSIFYDFPYHIDLSKRSNFLQIFMQLQNSGLSTDTISRITKICDIKQ